MANSHLSARLRYLRDSANLISTASSETSAYLMSQASQLMFDNEITPTESYRRHICGACGSIMTPGRTCYLEKEVIRGKLWREGTRSKAAGQKIEKKDADSCEKKATTSSIVYKCNLCKRNTKHRLPIYSVPVSRRGQKQLASLPANPTYNTTTAAASTNMSSKKRARNRKQGGLQALLAAKKANGASGSSSGFGLDLMDLMKKA